MFLWLWTSAFALEQTVPLSVMAAHAERVVVAEVTSAEARWEEGPRGDLETVVWLATEQVVQGEAPDTLEVLVEGGEIGGHRTWVSNQPVLEPDHRYLLVLVRDDAGRTRVIGQKGAIELQSERAPKAPKLAEVLAALTSEDATDVD